MSRFKTSKYRNAFSRVFKKEDWIHDLNVGSNFKSCSTHIKSSCSYVSFINDTSSIGAAAVLPLNSSGRFSSFPTVAGHSGSVTDLEFSPFDDTLLATGGEDGVVKLWKLPNDVSEMTAGISVPSTASLGPIEGAGIIDCLHFNPVADNILVDAVAKTVYLWDIVTQQNKYTFSKHENTVQGLCWNATGSLLATISKKDKQKQLFIIDPRTDEVVAESLCHTLTKESSVTWLGNTTLLVSTGYNTSREAEVALWDSTNMSKPLGRYSIGGGAGIPYVFYDEDALMLFVAIKGETSICFYELNNKALSIAPNSYRGTTQQKGVCPIPKRAVDVMSCEIDRFLILTQNAIVPVSFHVQRKSYSEFHEDLYPNTAGTEPSMTSEEWLSGAPTVERKKISLNPLHKTAASKPKQPAAVKETSDKGTISTTTAVAKSPEPRSKGSIENTQVSKTDEKLSKDDVDAPPPTAAALKALNIVRSSKVRHIEGYLLHKSTYLEKIPSLNRSIPGDSNGFTANEKRAAVAISGPGNRIAIFELNKPGRVDKGEIITVQNVTNIMDFTFDPFNSNRLIVACDDARIKVWDFPEDGLKESLVEPSFNLIGHYDRPNILKYHPLAANILATAGYDSNIYIWNVNTQDIAIKLEPLPESVFTLDWSPDGTMLAAVGKDRLIRIYKPLESTSPIATGNGPSGSRGARIIWLDNSYFAISGFDKSSQRLLSLYRFPSSLDVPLNTLKFDVSPAILFPHYDPDIKIIYLSGKGESIVMTVEFCPSQEPYLFTTASFSISSSHQAVQFLPKYLCNVKSVEVGRAVRLCNATIEPLGFKIPRVKTEYFQDDLYCDTAVTWKHVLDAEEWLKGVTKKQETMSLRPEGMKLLSEMPVQPATSSKQKYSSNVLKQKTDEEKKEELISAMITKMGDREDEPLPQDDMDGVDSDEWDDY